VSADRVVCGTSLASNGDSVYVREMKKTPTTKARDLKTLDANQLQQVVGGSGSSPAIPATTADPQSGLPTGQRM
jgi:bacteriocin-like protein